LCLLLHLRNQLGITPLASDNFTVFPEKTFLLLRRGLGPLKVLVERNGDHRNKQVGGDCNHKGSKGPPIAPLNRDLHGVTPMAMEALMSKRSLPEGSRVTDDDNWTFSKSGLSS